MAEIDSNYKYLTYEEMAKDVAEKALDEYIYKGKTLREWINILSSSEKPNKWISPDVIEKIKAEITEIAVEEIRIEEKWARGLHYAIKVIDKYISPTGAKKLGHWRTDKDNSRHWDRIRFYCSECGDWQTYGLTKYCPNCGARMEVKNGSDE